MTSIREQWQRAFEKASFYKSAQNTVEYWDKVAESGDSGITGDEKLTVLMDFLQKKLTKEGLNPKKLSVLDIGCGTGDYEIAFSPVFARITALDSSEKMLLTCKNRLEDKKVDNVSFICSDFFTFESSNKYDIVTAFLSPATYNPDAFDRMISLTTNSIIYFSMDTPIDPEMKEPVYCGTNTIRYPYEYLKSLGYEPEILPYVYKFKKADGKTVDIPFAYLFCKIK